MGIEFGNLCNDRTKFYFCLQMRLSVQFHGQIIFSLTCNANHLKFFLKEKVFSFLIDWQSMHSCAKTNSFSRISKTIISCITWLKPISHHCSSRFKTILIRLNADIALLFFSRMTRNIITLALG